MHETKITGRPIGRFEVNVTHVTSNGAQREISSIKDHFVINEKILVEHTNRMRLDKNKI